MRHTGERWARNGSGNAPVSVFFGDQPAEVVASVPLAADPGLWQINVRVLALRCWGRFRCLPTVMVR